MSKTPPSIRKEFNEIVKFGDRRTDPYKWMKDPDWQKVLQDPSALAPEIRKHLDAENAYFRDAAAAFSTLSADIAAEMKSRLKPREATLPEGDGVFEYWNEYRPQGNYRIYMQRNVASGEIRVLLDGDAEAEGRKFFDVAGLKNSPDHKTAAYMVDYEGAGNFSLRFRDIDTGLDLPDVLTGTKGQVVWSNNAMGVYYTECDDRNIAKRVKLHVIGTDHAADTVVFDAADNKLNVVIHKSQSGAYLLIESREGAAITVETHVLALADADAKPVLISPREAGHEYRVDHRNGDFYILTNTDGAANGKIMKAPEVAPARENWVDVVPYNPDVSITDFVTFKDFMVRKELCGALPRMVVSDYAGNEYVCDLPSGPSHLTGFPGQVFDANHLVIERQTPANPGELYDVDLRTGNVSLIEKTQLPGGHNPDDSIVEQNSRTARDGITEIPVTTLRHKSVAVDGTAPLYLYGYGAYGAGLSAEFSNGAMSMVDRGVIFAVAHVHGGNEKGLEWYHRGRDAEKWNTFYDFIDVAEGLADAGYGEKGKIVIEGRSAGGLLIGAVLNERPDLFAGAIAGESFLDVLNTMDDPTLPWVHEEKAEWGDPDDVKSFLNMRSYSPYDNIKKDVKYPPVLATTGIADPCVMYWEPAKWIARLRDEAAGGPFYLKVNTDSGHEGASARLESIDETAVEVGFALQQFEKCGYDLTPIKTPRITPSPAQRPAPEQRNP